MMRMKKKNRNGEDKTGEEQEANKKYKENIISEGKKTAMDA